MSFDLHKLLSPKSVAIVGASPRGGVAATRVINNLKKFGYAGTIYLVNPRYPEVRGLRCYPSQSELPTTPSRGGRRPRPGTIRHPERSPTFAGDPATME